MDWSKTLQPTVITSCYSSVSNSKKPKEDRQEDYESERQLPLTNQDYLGKSPKISSECEETTLGCEKFCLEHCWETSRSSTRRCLIACWQQEQDVEKQNKN
jgi:hypothetical protein